jgi:hypothetical protein
MPPPRAPLDYADLGPEPRLTPPKTTPHYPNPNPPASRSRKPSPCGSFFGFEPKTPSPSSAAWLRGPSTQTPVYPAAINPPLRQSELPCNSFSKTEPPWLDFLFLAQTTPPPHALLDCADPGPKLRFTPLKSTPHYPNPSPLVGRLPKQSLHGSVFYFISFLGNSPHFRLLYILYTLLHLQMYIHY